MIEKLELPSSARLVCGKDYDLAFKYIKQTVNQLVDAVNGILAAQEQYATIYKEDIMPMLMPENKTPSNIILAGIEGRLEGMLENLQ